MDFWKKKFAANVSRDKVTHDQLQKKQIRTLIVWECTIKKMRRDKEYNDHIMEQIERFLVNQESELEF